MFILHNLLNSINENLSIYFWLALNWQFLLFMKDFTARHNSAICKSQKNKMKTNTHTHNNNNDKTQNQQQQQTKDESIT